MKRKQFIFLASVVSLVVASTVQAKNLGCFCLCPKLLVKPRVYVDLGVGYPFSTHLPVTAYTVTDIPEAPPEVSASFLMSPQSPKLSNNVTLETGVLFENPAIDASPYFPFINLGLRYQGYLDHKNTAMEFSFISKGNPRGDANVSSQTDYEFLQKSLLANLKLDLYRWGRLMPYVNLGLGAAWNKTKQQAPFILPKLEEEGSTELVAMSAEEVRSVSYQLGAGLDYLVTDKFWLSLGYNYNNFGRVEVPKFFFASASAPDNRFFSLESRAFSFRNLTAHTLQLTGRYVFG